MTDSTSTRGTAAGPVTEDSMSHVLTLAGPEAESETSGKNVSGQGGLIGALQKSPLARAERASYKRGDVDNSYLYRFDGTDYCQWFGRKADGRFHPLGRIMQIIKAGVPS